jgi:hypothetical protein
MNFGIGNNARSRNKSFDVFVRKSIAMLASEIRRGWAVRFPVIADILVLSEDNIVPRSVAPGGSFSYAWLIEYRHQKPQSMRHTCIVHAASPESHSV